MDANRFALRRGSPYTTFCKFCREYGNPDISSISELMKQEKIPTSVEELLYQLVRERAASLLLQAPFGVFHDSTFIIYKKEVQAWEDNEERLNSQLDDNCQPKLHFRENADNLYLT